MNPEPPLPQKKRRGCFFYGCITCLVMVLVVLLGGFIVTKLLLSKLNRMVAEYTDTAPMTLPKSDISADDMKKLKARVSTFSAAIDAHSNTPPLVLTGPELNALIADNPNAKQFKDSIYVTLDGDAIKGQVSLPLDAFADMPPLSMLHLKGRYLNGSATMKAGVTNGMLGVYMQALEVKGKPMPAQFMTSFSQQNMADSYNKNPNNAAPFEHYESIQVKDSTMIVTPNKE
jgi:hypothetical protein